MRTIKFRVWDKKNKEMNFTDIASLHQGSAVKFNLMTPWRKNIFSDEWELMQYTGLKDKNGKEIYEGDILQEKNFIGEKKQVYVVEWFLNGFSYTPIDKKDQHGWVDGQYVEVIANIYENPKLLK